MADRVGSLEVGKDADFVIWSGNPLSTYAKAEQTWIDGRRYFDLDTDRRLREEAAAERSRLMTAALRAPRTPPGGPPGGGRPAAPAVIDQVDLGQLGWQRAFDAARTRLVAAALRARPPAGPQRGDAVPKAGPAAAELGQMAWRQWADAARALRHSYSGLPAAHECTEEAP